MLKGAILWKLQGTPRVDHFLLTFRIAKTKEGKGKGKKNFLETDPEWEGGSRTVANLPLLPFNVNKYQQGAQFSFQFLDSEKDNNSKKRTQLGILGSLCYLHQIILCPSSSAKDQSSAPKDFKTD